MNIVEPYANMHSIDGSIPTETSGVAALKRIEWCGRISHRSEESTSLDSYLRFISAVVIDHGDWSITEHASVTVDMLVDRGITHEIVRHRLFAFTQESTRFVNYKKKMPPSFINPFAADKANHPDQLWWNSAIQECEGAYKEMIMNGVAPQIARSVFPNALASRILITGNLRNWRLFLLMRTTKEAHPQMRQVTIPLLAEFKAKIPILYDDIEPNARQIDNMRKPR